MSLKAFPRGISAVWAALFLLSCGGKGESQERGTVRVQDASAASQVAGPIRFDPDPGWEKVAARSAMRLAQFRLPKAEGDAEDAELAIFFFGAGQGGGAQANLDRWVGQMEQPEGRASKDVAKVDRWEEGGLKFSCVDVSGAYVAETFPGSGERRNNPGFRLVAAVVEAPGGNVYFKATGLQKTIARWRATIERMLRSVRGA